MLQIMFDCPDLDVEKHYDEIISDPYNSHFYGNSILYHSELCKLKSMIFRKKFVLCLIYALTSSDNYSQYRKIKVQRQDSYFSDNELSLLHKFRYSLVVNDHVYRDSGSYKTFLDITINSGLDKVLPKEKCLNEFWKLMTNYCTSNNIDEEGNYLDPISFDVIEKPIICGTYCYSPETIFSIFIRSSNPVNPITNLPFTKNELKEIKENFKELCNIEFVWRYLYGPYSIAFKRECCLRSKNLTEFIFSIFDMASKLAGIYMSLYTESLRKSLVDYETTFKQELRDLCDLMKKVPL